MPVCGKRERLIMLVPPGFRPPHYPCLHHPQRRHDHLGRGDRLRERPLRGAELLAQQRLDGRSNVSMPVLGRFSRLGVIDVTAEEIPIMDGSASSFVFLLQQAGLEEQDAPKRFIRVLKDVEIRQGEKRRTVTSSSVPDDADEVVTTARSDAIF